MANKDTETAGNNLQSMGIFDFEIPAHTTRREWAVYVIVALHKTNHKKRFYVGKVGDNRDGCNPIISRIGNHFSHNKIHSQLRNKLNNTTDYNYNIFYATFGEYNSKKEQFDKDRINELERQLNKQIQKKLSDKMNAELLNPYKGVGVSKTKQLERESLTSEKEKETIKSLADKATE
jgi:hypothetical protein